MTTFSEFCQSCGGASRPSDYVDEATLLGDLAAATKSVAPADDGAVLIGGTDILRAAVASAAGLIPEAGGVLKGVIGYLWPAQEGEIDIWERIRSRVQRIARDTVDAATLDRLKEELKGLGRVAKAYADGVDPAAKKGKLEALMPVFEEAVPTFKETEPRHRLFPFLTTFGSIYLMLLREQARMARETATTTDEGNEANRLASVLTDRIIELRKAALETYELALVKRRDQISLTSHPGSWNDPYSMPPRYYEWTRWKVRDEHDGWEDSWLDGNEKGNRGVEDAEGKARRAFEARQSSSRAELEGALAPFLALQAQWPGLDLSADALPELRRLEWSPLVGARANQANLEFDSTAGLSQADSARLRRIVVWRSSDAGLGIRIEYEDDGVPQDRSLGYNPAEHPETSELTLEPGERIVAACVLSKSTLGQITGIRLQSDRGRSVRLGDGTDDGATSTLVFPSPPPGGYAGLAGVRLSCRRIPDSGPAEACGIQFLWDIRVRSRATADLLWKLRMDRLPPRPKVLAPVTQAVWMEFLDRFGAESNPATAAATQSYILQNAVAPRLPDGTVDYQSAPGVEVIDWVVANAQQIHAAAFPRTRWDAFITGFQAASTPAEGAKTASYILQAHDAPLTAEGKIDYASPQASWTWGWVHEHASMLALAEP